MNDSPSTLSQVGTPPSLQEVAFQAIKKAIINKELSTEPTYSEQALAKQMGMSKTPVHQALLELESRGFVTLMARKGFKVKALTAKNISDMFEMRRALERTVVRKITPRLTTKDIEQLEQIVKRMGDNRDPVDFQTHDRAFHRYLASISDNQYIISSLNTVWDLSDWVGAYILANWGRFQEAAREHLAVYEFLVAGDAEKAAAAMDRHLNGTEQRFLEGF